MIPALKPPPPRPVVRAAFALYGALLRAAEQVLPAEVTMMQRIGGFWSTALLRVAGRLAIAEHLSAGPMTAAELARITGANEDALHRSLRALSAMGIFHLDRRGRFSNNRLSETLRPGRVSSMKDIAEYFGSESNLAAWNDFERTVMTGESAFPRVHGVSVWEWFASHPDEMRAFAGSMTSMTEQAAPAIAGAYPFGKHARICDVAGSKGTLLAEILVQHPQARGVLFDAPHVLAEAPPYLGARGVLGRVETVAGSFFESVPEGCDAYVLKDILHDWDDARCITILENCRRAMAGGAGGASRANGSRDTRLLVAEVLVDRASTEPPGPLIDVQMLAVCDGGRQRTAGEMGALFARCGLELRAVHPSPMPNSVIEAALR
jgi:hypothetical protein